MKDQLTRIKKVIQYAYLAYTEELKVERRFIVTSLAGMAACLLSVAAIGLYINNSVRNNTIESNGRFLFIFSVLFPALICLTEWITDKVLNICKSCLEKRKISRTCIAENKELLSFIPVRFSAPQCVEYIENSIENGEADSLEQALMLADHRFYPKNAKTALTAADKKFIKHFADLFSEEVVISTGDQETKKENEGILNRIAKTTINNEKWYIRAISRSSLLILYSVCFCYFDM